MKQIKKLKISMGILLGLMITHAQASVMDAIYITPKRFWVINDNVGKVLVEEDISSACPGNAFKINLNQVYGKIMWQTLLTYEVSHQFSSFRVYPELIGGVCYAKKIELTKK